MKKRLLINHNPRVVLHGKGRLDNGLITRATAKIARQGLKHLFLSKAQAARHRIHVERKKAHDKARGAETALARMTVHQSLLNRVQGTAI